MLCFLARMVSEIYCAPLFSRTRVMATDMTLAASAPWINIIPKTQFCRLGAFAWAGGDDLKNPQRREESYSDFWSYQKLWVNSVFSRVDIMFVLAHISCRGLVPNPLEPNSEFLTTPDSLNLEMMKMQEIWKPVSPGIYKNIEDLGNPGIRETWKYRHNTNHGNVKVRGMRKTT